MGTPSGVPFLLAWIICFCCAPNYGTLDELPSERLGWTRSPRPPAPGRALIRKKTISGAVLMAVATACPGRRYRCGVDHAAL